MANNEFSTEQPGIRAAITAPHINEGRYTSWFVIELERHLHSLPFDTRQSTLQEVEEHLRSSRLALEELGLDENDCDKEAVKRFGTPAQFAAQILKLHEAPPVHVPLLFWITAFAMCSLACLPVFMYYNVSLGKVILLVTVPAFVFLSWRAKTFQWKGFLWTGGAVTSALALLMGFTWVNLTTAGGLGDSPRWALSTYKITSQQAVEQIPNALATCDAAAARFKAKDSSIDRPGVTMLTGGNVAFVLDDFYAGPFIPNYHLLENQDEEVAADTWRQYVYMRQTWVEDLRIAQNQIPACDLAARRVFDPITAAEGAAGGLFMTFVALLLNFLTSMVRSMYDTIRRLPKRLVA